MSFIPDPQIIEKFKYCPTCSKSFHDRKLIDIFAKGYECENGHRYISAFKMVTMNETQPEHMKLACDAVEAIDIAKKWLTEDYLRAHLNPQLATMLRACVDIEAGSYKKLDKVEKFLFCPWCSTSVKEVPSDDCWVIAKECLNGHKFLERGYNIGIDAVFLEHEITHNFLIDCLNSYLSEPGFSKYVPIQLKSVLKTFLKKYHSILQITPQPTPNDLSF